MTPEKQYIADVEAAIDAIKEISRSHDDIVSELEAKITQLEDENTDLRETITILQGLLNERKAA